MTVCEWKGDDLEVVLDHETNTNKLYGHDYVECRRKGHRRHDILRGELGSREDEELKWTFRGEKLIPQQRH